MANWTVSASTPAETEAAQMWTMVAQNEARVATFWANHLGKRGDNGQAMHIVDVDDRLTKSKGDTVNSTLVMHLSTAGIASGSLEGSEESPTRYGDSVLIGRLRNAIRTDSVLSEQRAHFDIREEMAKGLSYWGSRFLLDKWIFTKLSGSSYTDKNAVTIGEAGSANTNIIYAGGATALNELEASMEFELDLTRKAKLAASIGQLNGSTIYKIKPYFVGGQPYYCHVDRPEVRYQLRNTSEWREAQLNARERSSENPIFSGIDGMDDGVIHKFHDLVVTGSNAGSGANVTYSNGLFLGTQAGCLYPAQPAPDWIEKTFDYNEQYGMATGMTQGFDKLQYNSIDFAVIAIRSSINAQQ